MKLILYFIVLSFFFQTTIAQELKKKGQFFGCWGYNIEWYTKSTIHFKNNKTDNYDFKLYNVKAKDKPDFQSIPTTNISIPQYNYRIGYFFPNNFGFEINFDHTKYVVQDYQRVKVSGYIHEETLSGDTVLDPIHFIHFEHTDGANMLMLNGMYKKKLFSFDKPWIQVFNTYKFGMGAFIPRTDVYFQGKRVNNKFHVAGFVAGIESGLRIEFLKHGFLDYSLKTFGVVVSNALACGDGKVKHNYGGLEMILTLGFQFPL